MKKEFYKKSNAIMRMTAWVVIYAFLMLPSGVAFAAGGNPPALSTVKIPAPPNLGDFVKDKKAAIQLGKALFWDANTGGDGGQACASCHYRAGADPINQGPNGAPGLTPDGLYPSSTDLRATNQVNPGPNGLFDATPVHTPNQLLLPGDFPFFTVSDPLNAELIRDGSGNALFKTPVTGTLRFDDVVGSQGVSFNLFTSLNPNNVTPNNPRDLGTPVDDPTFHHSRRVTGRNTPPAINAVFNYANFWDGRANNIFNGSSPLGPLDASAGIWVNLAGPTDGPVLQFQKVAIPNASTASQSVGPPNNNTEMSWDGRNFPLLGRKLLSLTPLGQQLVADNDSTLGPLSCQLASNATTTTCILQGGKGINKSYAALIQQAFYEKYWDSFAQDRVINGIGFSQMEANFSLFWGLSVMLYEATLVSDKTPFDKYLVSNNILDMANAVTDPTGTIADKGRGLFLSKCSMCHAGSELSDATVSDALANGLIDKGQTVAGGAISDNGFHNLGVSPTAADIGRGGVGGAPFIQNGFSISSFAQEAIAQANGGLLFTAPQAIFDGITATTPVAVNGSHKTPQLRNVALNAPYMHNGSMLTLAEVVDFYSRGGNFANAEQAKEIQAPVAQNNASDRAALVVFMQNALTDPRVDAELAPFDHPQLKIPDGTSATANDNNTDPKIVRPATGGSLAGYAFDLDNYLATRLCDTCVETTTLDTLPKAEVSAPTGTISTACASLTVTVTNGDSFKVSTDGGTTFSSPIVAGPTTVCNLHNGDNALQIVGVNQPTVTQQINPVVTTINVNVPQAPSAPALDAVAAEGKDDQDGTPITKNSGNVITGHKAATDTVSGSCATASVVCSDNGATFTCQVSNMADGDNTVTVTVSNASGSQSSQKTIRKVSGDGCFGHTGTPIVSDALQALKMVVGIVTATADNKSHGDVNLNGKMDSGDALMILKKSIGLVSY